MSKEVGATSPSRLKGRLSQLAWHDWLTPSALTGSSGRVQSLESSPKGFITPVTLDTAGLTGPIMLPDLTLLVKSTYFIALLGLPMTTMTYHVD